MVMKNEVLLFDKQEKSVMITTVRILTRIDNKPLQNSEEALDF